jgi:hypothetical protein
MNVDNGQKVTMKLKWEMGQTAIEEVSNRISFMLINGKIPAEVFWVSIE